MVEASSVKGPMWALPVHQAEAPEFRSGAAPRLGLAGTEPCLIVQSRGLAGRPRCPYPRDPAGGPWCPCGPGPAFSGLISKKVGSGAPEVAGAEARGDMSR